MQSPRSAEANPQLMPLAVDARPSVRPLGGRIGATIEDVQLSGSLDLDTIKTIRSAVLKHKVVFLRQQKGSDADLEAFAELYDEPLVHPIHDAPGSTRYTYEMEASKEFRADHWHTDFSFREEFVDGGILYPVQLSEVGGETVWSNTAAAYEELPAPLKAMVNRLVAVHSSDMPLEMTFPDADPELLEATRVYRSKIGQSARHPVVRVHPETGERSLLLGNFFHYFVGFARVPGGHIYDLLHYYLTRPENTIRWHWAMGDVAIWDNRSSLHYGVRDFSPARRIMRRISVGSSVPVGVDGIRSRPA